MRLCRLRPSLAEGERIDVLAKPTPPIEESRANSTVGVECSMVTPQPHPSRFNHACLYRQILVGKVGLHNRRSGLLP